METNTLTVNSIQLSNVGLTEFELMLKKDGFTPGGAGDYTTKSYMLIPTPRCAFVNITSPDGNAVWPISKSNDYKYYMEFYDGAGNYFKKEIIFGAQGNSSMAFIKKNGKADFCNNNGWNDDDTFKMKIGDWVTQDSFHFKAYYTDYLRGAAIVAYQVADEVYKTRGIYADRPWKKALIDFDKIRVSIPDNYSEEGISDIDLLIDNGARCMPDGFPAIFYLNGEFYGIYSWLLKKHRDNYHLNKSIPEHILLDGDLYPLNLWGGTVNWNNFEIRNPKSLYCMEGSKYDGDNPKELIDETSENYDSTNKNHKNSAKVKQYIINLSKRIGEINTLDSTDSGAAKALFDSYFDADNLVDYHIINMAIGDSDAFGKNWLWITYDGIKWYVCQYDKDMSLGNLWTGMRTTVPHKGYINSSTDSPIGLAIRYYKGEYKARWQELVNKGVFTPDNIKTKVLNWVNRIGRDMYKKEWKKWPESPCNRDSNIDYENWRFTGSLSSSLPTTSKPIWDNTTTYNEGLEVWFKGFDGEWYFRFRATKENTNKPCLTKSYSVYPKSMGYHDSIWRYFKYIELLLTNLNDFINNL